jgi:hypothetical protein
MGNCGEPLGNGSAIFVGKGNGDDVVPASIRVLGRDVVAVGVFDSGRSADECSSVLTVTADDTIARLPTAGELTLGRGCTTLARGCCASASATTAPIPRSSAMAMSGSALALRGGGGGSESIGSSGGEPYAAWSTGVPRSVLGAVVRGAASSRSVGGDDGFAEIASGRGNVPPAS